MTNRLDRIIEMSGELWSRRKLLLATLKSSKAELADFAVRFYDDIEVQKMIQELASGMQQKAHKQITAVVTKCLQSVFGQDLSFRIKFDRKRGKTQARMVFVRSGVEIKPDDSESGGVIDLAALALRISCIMLATPKRRRVLVLDEPLRNVHGAEYRERTTEVIESLAKELGFQLLIVTGLDWLRVGRVIQLRGEKDV